MQKKKTLKARNILIDIDKSVIDILSDKTLILSGFSYAIENHIKKILHFPEKTSWVSVNHYSYTTAFVIYSRNLYDFIETNVKFVACDELE